MSLKTEVLNLLADDASVIYYLDDASRGIVYAGNEDNYPKSNNYIVFDARIADTIHNYSNKQFVDQYSVTIQAISTSSVTNDDLAKEIRRAMQAYSSSNLKNIYFERDNENFNYEDKSFTLSLDFTVIYQK